MRRAIFSGTFDFFTIGHHPAVERTLAFMGEIIIGIGINENKNTYFPIGKREETIRNLYKGSPCTRAMSYDCLMIDLAQQVEAQSTVRGIHTVKDFEYEETIASINRKLAGIKTILLSTEPEPTCVGLTTVCKLLTYNKGTSQFTPGGMEINWKSVVSLLRPVLELASGE